MNQKTYKEEPESQALKKVVHALMAEPLKLGVLFLSACYMYGWILSYVTVTSYLKLPGFQFILSLPHEIRLFIGFCFFLYIMVTLLFAELILRPFRFRIVHTAWTTRSKKRAFIRAELIVGAVIYIGIIIYFLEWSASLSLYFRPFFTLLTFLVFYLLFVRWYSRVIRRSGVTITNTLLLVILTCVMLAIPPFTVTQILPYSIIPHKPEKLVVIRTKFRLDSTSRISKNGSYNTSGYLAGKSYDDECYVFLTPDSRNAYLVPKKNVELISAKVGGWRDQH